MIHRIYRQEPDGFREYEVEFHPDSPGWQGYTVGGFIRQREGLKLPTLGFKRCFLCGRHLGMEKEMLPVYVSGIGIRLSCTQCYNAETRTNARRNSAHEKAEL